MTDFPVFVAHNILTAAELNGALNSIDAVAQAAKLAVSGAESDAQTALAAAAGAASVAGAAQVLAEAALPATQVGVAGGVPSLGDDSIILAKFPSQGAAVEVVRLSLAACLSMCPEQKRSLTGSARGTERFTTIPMP